MRLNKIVSGAAVAAMLGTMMCTTAFAADYTDGDYTGEIHFLNANGSGNYSMCDPIFVHEAELALTADNAELTFMWPIRFHHSLIWEQTEPFWT